MSIIRGELRLLKTNVCQAEGIYTIDSFLNTQHLNDLWNKHFQMLLDASRGYALEGESFFQGKIVNILENIIQSNGFRVTDLAKVISGIGGIAKTMEYMGGNVGFNLWLNSLDIHRQKKSRIRREIQQLLNIADQLKESPIQVDVWSDFAHWLEM
jgi:hypothetical protein